MVPACWGNVLEAPASAFDSKWCSSSDISSGSCNSQLELRRQNFVKIEQHLQSTEENFRCFGFPIFIVSWVKRVRENKILSLSWVQPLDFLFCTVQIFVNQYLWLRCVDAESQGVARGRLDVAFARVPMTSHS